LFYFIITRFLCSHSELKLKNGFLIKKIGLKVIKTSFIDNQQIEQAKINNSIRELNRKRHIATIRFSAARDKHLLLDDC
jgi:hypothetical protein